MNLKGNTYFAATASFDGTVNIVNVLVDTKNKPHVTYRFKASSEELYCVVHMPDPDPARPMVLANPATRCRVDASPRRSRPTLRTPAVAAPPTYPSGTVIAMQNCDLH